MGRQDSSVRAEVLLRRSTSSQWTRLRWDAREAGRLLGTAAVTFPTGENSTYADIAVRVALPNRRRGVGTALLRAMLPELQALNVMAEQPLGDISYTYPTWTVERVRQREAEQLKAGQSRRYVVAVDEHTGTVAGFTEVAIDPEQQDHIRQGDTGVLSAFRGHGLGVSMRSSMLRWLTADLPELRLVRTMTASENTHMIRVNARLGYHAHHTLSVVQSDLSALDTLLSTRGGPQL